MSLLGTFGPLSIIILFYILARLSERFGSVIRMPPIYRYYYVGIVFLAISWATHLFISRATLTFGYPAWIFSSWFLLLAYHLPLAIGVTLGLVVTWRYWSWLVTEQRNG